MAKVIADPTGGVTIGIDKVHYAVLTKDDVETAPTYGTVKALPNAKSMQVTPSDSIQTEYYDNAPKITAVSKGDKQVTFVKSDFSDEDLYTFLGFDKNDEGVVIETGDAIQPYIALGFRTKTTKGYRYYWLLKGMMMTPEIAGATTEQSTTFQNQTINGTFITRVCDNSIQVMRNVSGDEDTETFATTWFSTATLTQLYKGSEDGED